MFEELREQKCDREDGKIAGASKDEEGDVDELKRSMSIQIPEDWEKIGLTLYNRVHEEEHIKARELGMMSLPADALEPVPVIEDNSYYEYFETILSFSELYEARKKLVNNYVTKENIPPEDLKYSRYYHNFRRWWVLSRYDVDMNGYQLLDFRYSTCLLYTSPSPRDQRGSRMPSSA